MKKSNSISYLIKEGFRNVWVNRLMSIASIGVLMSCLILLGCSALVMFNINAFMSTMEDQNVIMMYIEDGQLEADIQRIGEEINDLSNVASCTFISKEDALKEQLSEINDVGDAYSQYFQGLEDENPLPDAYQIVLEDISLHDNTLLELKKIEGIESISDRGDIAYKLATLKNMIYVACFWVIGILLIVSLFIISNTIKLTMYSRRLEISIMKSVGATNGFIRVPFMVEGMTIGALAAVVSYVIVYYIYATAIKAFGDISFLGNMISFSSVALVLGALFVVIGIGSGAIGSAISINRYLKREGSAINEV